MRISRQCWFGVGVQVAGIALLLLLPSARAQNPADIMPDASAAKAKAILQQAIDGLGGAAYLNVHNSECTGRFALLQHSREIVRDLQLLAYREIADKRWL